MRQVRSGNELRLVITIPPRCLKSITVAVAYVAFLLGHDPTIKIIVASYGLDLARKHSDDCRRVMQTAWYRSIFPNTRLATRGNTAEDIKTTEGGSRKAVSIGSAVTGHGADVIIIDDLLKAGDAQSEAELLRAQDFIEGTLLPRFDNPPQGRVIMVAQRLHEMDPPGYLIDQGTYKHLNLPAIAEEGAPLWLLKHALTQIPVSLKSATLLSASQFPIGCHLTQANKSKLQRVARRLSTIYRRSTITEEPHDDQLHTRLAASKVPILR